MRGFETTILKFIGGLNKVFIIPPFQRNYEWTTEQCDELFNDLLEAVRSNKNHYLGNIIYYEGEKNGASFSEYILVDGQQRVTTILLLLCAIRDMTDDEKLKKKIGNQYLKNEDADDDAFRIRLKQTDYDEGCFSRLVNGTLGAEESGKIYDNYKRFKELIADCGVDLNCLFELIPKLEVVEVNLQTNNLETVQTVFEKINSTGKPLSPADLIRNYLLIASNAKQQEKLYKHYWIKIEEIITTEFISDFVKDYLIMNICDEVIEKEVYKDFKEYIKKGSLDKETVLKEMKEYAPFYKQIITNATGKDKLDREIQILKFLGSSDMYCLFMYILRRSKEENTDPTVIFHLIRCFLSRFRIVGAYGGGGALRSVVYSLIKKMKSGEVQCSFEAIQFELSNSTNKIGSYPDDAEFKAALMSSQKKNHNYGRAILLAIEEHETRNIPVEFDKVTIEHLMPQTLNEWWINNLGGQEQAQKIYDKYLNCIGNLAPLSGPYNSENSNRPWPEKIKIMKGIQFVTTQEVLNKDIWNEDSINERNKSISERACSAILGPIPRTRFYSSQTIENLVSGDYSILDLSTNMDGSNILSLTINDTTITVKKWNQLLVKVSEYVRNIDANKFDEIVRKNLIHKNTRAKNPPAYDPIFTENKDLLNSPKRIPLTSYFVEGNISCSRARYYTNSLLKEYSLQNGCTLKIEIKED